MHSGQFVAVTLGFAPKFADFACTVQPGYSNDTVIECLTAPGDGNALRFKLAVGVGSSAQFAIGSDEYSYPPHLDVFSVSGCSRGSSSSRGWLMSS